MSVRLDFVGVGPQRTATTWVYEHFRRHPAAWVFPEEKESFFFDRHYDRGPDWYARRFRSASAGMALGEVGSTYFHQDVARRRIHAHSPDARVVITLREPLSRIGSLYRHLQRLGEIPADMALDEAVVAVPHLVETSRYATHTEAWQHTFGTDRVAVLLFEDLVSDAERFSRQLCAAVAIETVPLPDDLRRPVNAAMEPRNRRLAVWAAKTNMQVRRMGLHRVPSMAKRVGLQRVLESGVAAPIDVAGAFAAQTFGRMRDEYEGVADLVGVDLAPWRAQWERLGLPP